MSGNHAPRAFSLGSSLAFTPTLGAALAGLCLVGGLWLNNARAAAHGHPCPQLGVGVGGEKSRVGGALLSLLCAPLHPSVDPR